MTGDGDGPGDEVDEVKTNDDVKDDLDEKLSMDLVVVVTKLRLSLVAMEEVSACENVLLTDVGRNSTDDNVAFDEETTGSEDSNAV